MSGILPCKVCVHEVQARVLTISRPDIRVSPGGEPVEMGEHLNQIIVEQNELRGNINLLGADNCRTGQEGCKIGHRRLYTFATLA